MILYWSHFAQLCFGVYALRSFDGDALRNHILILYFYLQLVCPALKDRSEVSLDRVYLHEKRSTSMSRWSLSLRSAWTIMVRRSRRRLISLPLSIVLMRRVCGPSLRISTMLLAELVSLFFMELIFTFLSSGASVTKYFWLISLMG